MRRLSIIAMLVLLGSVAAVLLLGFAGTPLRLAASRSQAGRTAASSSTAARAAAPVSTGASGVRSAVAPPIHAAPSAVAPRILAAPAAAGLVRHDSFFEGFDGPAGARPNPAVWSFDTGTAWGEPAELADYTSHPGNVSLNGHGELVITARREAPPGGRGKAARTGRTQAARRGRARTSRRSHAATGRRGRAWTSRRVRTRASRRGRPAAAYRYTSARIETWRKLDFTYGTISARIKVPRGRGLWPAFWALGSSAYAKDNWPASGEIDVMELLGAHPRVAYGTLHGPSPHSAAGYEVQGTYRSRAPLSGGFHTYAANWTPDSVTFAVDGHPYRTVTRSDLPPHAGWPFDRPFFLVLDLAVGGKWGGDPTAATHWPARMLVKWVRVGPAAGHRGR